MSQIQKKFIKDQAIDESKILLSNQGELKARNAANSADVSLLKLDGSDILKMLKLPRLDSLLSAPSDAKDLTPKEYVDQAEADAVSSANSYTDGEVALLEAEDLTFVKLDGSRALTGPMDAGSQRLTLVSDPTDPQDAATKNYVDGEVFALDAEDLTFLKLDGSRAMTGLLDMGSNLISEVSDPVSAQDAATKAYVDGEFQSKLTDELGVSIATLVTGKVPVSQLPNAIMEYQGMWNASTNTPALSNTGNAAEDLGNVYKVSVAGSHDFGAGAISFEVGDYAILGSSGWEKADTSDAVTSVNGQAGIVVLDAGDIAVSPTVEGGADVQSALEGLESAVAALNALSIEFKQEKQVLDSTDIANGYIDLTFEAIPASINAFVDRLAIHETDDYTVSVVGGVTRITFAGNLISPSEEQVAIGDVVRVKYAKVGI